MHPRRPAHGHRPFALPSGIDDLERTGAVPGNDGLALIRADRETLLWSQHLDSGVRAVFKMYRQRGPISWWREKHFRFRVQREYDALTRLDRFGILCSRPLFWFWDSSSIHGHFEVLVTREIPNAAPLDVFLQSRAPRIHEVDLCPLYTTVARMHLSGLHHGALYASNILVSSGAAGQIEFHIIDVPKAMSFPFSIVGTRMAWIDLLSLSESVGRQIGHDRCLPLLERYGVDERSAMGLARCLKCYRPSRHTRNRYRAECGLRYLIARAGPFRGEDITAANARQDDEEGCEGAGHAGRNAP